MRSAQLHDNYQAKYGTVIGEYAAKYGTVIGEYAVVQLESGASIHTFSQLRR
jgi:hypothetical protein